MVVPDLEVHVEKASSLLDIKSIENTKEDDPLITNESLEEKYTVSFIGDELDFVENSSNTG